MALAIFYDKEALKREGDESTIYCSICRKELSLGPYMTLFCPRCGLVGSKEVKIDSIMSCVHCEQPLVAKKNYDGRVTGRCETENCGDCWSMQDLCLIWLPKAVFPEGPEGDPFILYLQNVKEAEKIGQEWVDIKTLDCSTLQQEILDHFLEKNPGLVRSAHSTTLVNQALVNAARLTHDRLRNISSRKENWYSISCLAQENKVKKEAVIAVVTRFSEESCPVEARYYIRRRGRTLFVHSEIYPWITRQIRNEEKE